LLAKKCECHKDKQILVSEVKTKPDLLHVNFTWSGEAYTIPKLLVKTATCDLYNSFKSGLNQKVVSFSLYGQNERYYEVLKCIK